MRQFFQVSARLRRAISVLSAVTVVIFAGNGFSAMSVFATGGLTNASSTLSDPRPNAPAASVTYSVSWAASSTATLKCLTYTFSNSPDVGQGTTPTGFSSTSAANGSFTNLTTGNWTINNATNGTVTETDNTGQAVASGTQVTTPIQSLTNPTNSSGQVNYIDLNTYSDAACSTLVDSTIVAFTTVPSVLVSATIDSTLSFAVTGVAASTTYKGALATADRCSDAATTVSYGSPTQPLAADTNYDCAQTLTTSTNSDGGYQVTVQGKQASGDFLSLISDPTKTITNWTGSNGTPTASPISGSSQVFAYTTSDTSLSGVSPSRFTSSDNLFAGLTTTPDQVAYNATPIANDAVNVGYRLRFTGTTQAGVYRGTLVYTCTPVF